jgi:hypothetical protein
MKISCTSVSIAPTYITAGSEHRGVVVGIHAPYGGGPVFNSRIGVRLSPGIFVGLQSPSRHIFGCLETAHDPFLILVVSTECLIITSFNWILHIIAIDTVSLNNLPMRMYVSIHGTPDCGV